jgi:hypothetical protein
VFLGLLQAGQASWQYSNGQTDTSGGFTYQATVTENPANAFTGTAVLTSYAGTEYHTAIIPSQVPILITVNTTNQDGQPIQYPEWVSCTVTGFAAFNPSSVFNLESDNAIWTGDVNVTGNFYLNGHTLTVSGEVKQRGPMIMDGGTLTTGGRMGAVGRDRYWHK